MRNKSTGVKLGIASGFLISPLIPISWRSSASLVLVTILVATGIAVFATHRLTKQIKEKYRAWMSIRELKEDLEKKVTERTKELADTVEALQGEMRERRAREADLRRLAAIVEYSDDAIIAITLDGIVTDWNAGAERMLGYSRSEIIGSPIAVTICPDHREEPAEDQARIKRGDTVVRRESVRITKTG
jgi:PAS domain-containing protein